jgi:hypothetical protein
VDVVEAFPELLQQDQGELENILCGSSDEETLLPQTKDIEASTNSHRGLSNIRLLPSSTNKCNDATRRALDLLDDNIDDVSHDEKDQEEEVRSRRRPR